MADDRPAESETEAIARLQREVEDMRSTLMMRVSRRPTGDIEPTIRTTSKPDALLLQGQAVNRTDYPVLWQWVQDQGLVVAGLFTVGNGTTTFGLPDFRGRVPVGVGTLGADSYALGSLTGSARVTLTTAQLPAHDHDVTVATHPTHNHYFVTAQGGNHGGHASGGSVLVPDGAFYGVLPGAPANSGSHNHDGYTAVSGASGATAAGNTHAVTQTTVGTGAAVDARPPAIGVNWMIYT